MERDAKYMPNEANKQRMALVRGFVYFIHAQKVRCEYGHRVSKEKVAPLDMNILT